MFILLMPAVIVAAIGLGVVRAVEAVEHAVKRHSLKSLVK
jgi:ABC-type long-subunit fatty acid transport system fused permease/ATPase subunit